MAVKMGKIGQRGKDSRGDMTRRHFLRTSASAGLGFGLMLSGAKAWAADGGPLKTRVLGRTGCKVTVLGLGTAPVGEGPPDVQEGIKVFEPVLDAGVNYVDTARIYGNAEEILGQVLPKRRDKVFLVTKVSTDSGQRAEQSLEQSLRTLKTDYLDLVHIHSIGGKNIDRVLAPDGVLEYLLKQKQAGKIRFIGTSGHNRPANFVRMIQTDQIDVVMPVMNYADCNIYNCEDVVLPEARKRNIGVVAMKVYVGIKGGFPNHRSGFVGCVTPQERMPQAIAYALDLEGVSSAVIGPYTAEQAMQNVEFAKKYTPLTSERRTELLAYGKTLAPTLGPRYGAVV